MKFNFVCAYVFPFALKKIEILEKGSGMGEFTRDQERERVIKRDTERERERERERLTERYRRERERGGGEEGDDEV